MTVVIDAEETPKNNLNGEKRNNNNNNIFDVIKY